MISFGERFHQINRSKTQYEICVLLFLEIVLELEVVEVVVVVVDIVDVIVDMFD